MVACVAVAIAVGIFLYPHLTKIERKPNLSPQAPVADFVLLDHTGRSQSLYLNGDAEIIAIAAYDGSCKHSDAQVARLKALEEKYGKDKLRVFLLAKVDEDERARMIERGMPFPVLMDNSKTVFGELDLYSAGHVTMVASKGWKLLYNGNMFAKEAAVALGLGDVAGKGGTCDLEFPPLKNLNYAEHIAPMFMGECLSCHSQTGGFQPYFDSYEKVKSWTAMIKETVMTDRMPPFSGDPMYGPYINDISLTPRQKYRLISWINNGAPRGEGPDPLLKWEPNPFHEKFLANNKPIFTISMSEPIKIPPKGIPEYQYFQLGGKVERDMWITAVHTKTTNPRQLHHECLMVTDRPLKEYERLAERNRKKIDPNAYDAGEVRLYTLETIIEDPSRYSRLQNITAGVKQPVIFKHGSVWHVKKGHYLILEAHYMGTGKWETEQTTVDLYGTYEKGDRATVHQIRLLTGDIDIPPGARGHIAKSRAEIFKHDSKFLGFTGHMHMRGRAIKVRMTKPGKPPEYLLSVPNYYYGWQTGSGIVMKNPVPIPAGTEVQLECEYDNSALNPNNPDPKRRVRKGQRLDRTEMCHASLQYILDSKE